MFFSSLSATISSLSLILVYSLQSKLLMLPLLISHHCLPWFTILSFLSHFGDIHLPRLIRYRGVSVKKCPHFVWCISWFKFLFLEVLADFIMFLSSELWFLEDKWGIVFVADKESILDLSTCCHWLVFCVPGLRCNSQKLNLEYDSVCLNNLVDFEVYSSALGTMVMLNLRKERSNWKEWYLASKKCQYDQRNCLLR